MLSSAKHNSDKFMINFVLFEAAFSYFSFFDDRGIVISFNDVIFR